MGAKLQLNLTLEAPVPVGAFANPANISSIPFFGSINVRASGVVCGCGCVAIYGLGVLGEGAGSCAEAWPRAVSHRAGTLAGWAAQYSPMHP